MIEKQHVFAMGNLTITGRVSLSQAGYDLMRAILMRGLRRARAGKDKCKILIKAGSPLNPHRQLAYYTHAEAFLTHLLSTMTATSMDIRDELHALRSVPTDAPYPMEWNEALRTAAELELPDEPTVTPPQGRGASHRGKPVLPADADGGGSGRADGATNGEDPNRRKGRGRKSAG